MSKTFQDLRDYIRTAETNGFGVHQIIGFPDTCMHIYSTKTQVNICQSLNGVDMPVAIGDIVFIDDDLVRLVRVNSKGYADYDHPMELPVTTDLDDVNWIGAFSSKGRMIKQYITAALSV